LGPTLSVVTDSFTSPRGEATLAAYRRILWGDHNAHVGSAPMSAILNSLHFGFWAGVIALATGVAFAFGLARGLVRRRPAVETLALAPIVVSSVALGYGYLVTFRRGLFGAIPPDWRVILVHATLAFPFVVRAFRPVLDTLDRRLFEAARSLGAPPLRAFVDVELPLLLKGVLVAFAFAFGLSISEMSATMMLARSDVVTMPVSVYRLLAARDFQGASAMAVLLMVVSGGVFIILELLARERTPRARPEGSTHREP